jgi:hypothetical protein
MRRSQSKASPADTSSALPDQDPDEFGVDFTAGRVEVDVQLNELELADEVTVVVDRYRLTADQLKLWRGDRGIVVDGDGQVAFCRCPEPPITVGFSGATVAPPTDLLIEDPTLRIAGVPVLWLPYIWLRAPDRLGLLPPRVRYSSEEGVFAGAGVHIPLDERTFVDLEAGGYLWGGVDTRLRIDTPRNNARLRFDHLDDSMVAIDARGVAHVPGFSSAGYTVDMIRGPRALTATPVLLAAAQRYDRARAEVGRHHGFAFYGVGGSLTASRGGDFDAAGAWGPSLHVGIGEALLGFGEAESWLSLATQGTGDSEAVSTLEHQGVARFHARPALLAVEAELRHRLGLNSKPNRTMSDVAVAGQVEVGVPLRRRFGGSDPLLHYVMPLLSVGAQRHVTLGEVGTDAVAEGAVSEASVSQASGGVSTQLGRWGGQQGAQLEARAGWVRNEGQVARVAAFKLLTSSDLIGASLRGGRGLAGGSGWALASRVRIGPEYSHHVMGYAQGERNVDGRLSSFLNFDSLSHSPFESWYDLPGVSAGSEASLRWTSWLSSAFGADYDVEASELLGVRGSLAYRHPCGCLATVAWAGHRLGRRGVDARLTVDLIP